MSRARVIVPGMFAFLLALGAMAVSATACGSGGGGAEPTTLTTTLAGESKEGETITVLEGSKVKDKATLSGKNASTATGKVKYDVYPESGCKGTVKAAGEVTVSGTSVPASTEETLTGGASYYWQTTYSGDSKNSGSTSSCTEISTIKAETKLSTTLSGESKEGEEITVTEGATISDSATLTGMATSMATGTVKYDVYSDWECKDLVSEAGEATVSGEFVPSSSAVTLAHGTYYWRATYSGDALNESSTSVCGAEIAVVNPAVTTTLSNEGQTGEGLEVQEGSAVSDKATLHGEHASIATGTVKYKIYSDSECKELVTNAGEVSVSGATVPASSEETLSPGTYYWQADYSGDSKNPAAKSTCGTETALVTTATSLTTSLSGESKSGTTLEIKEGSPVSDAATLSGADASTATGYVEYNVYSDSECKELVAEAGEGNVTSGSVPASSEETLPVGTYYWQAVYSGDGVNHSSTSTCGSEISIVTAPVTTSLSGEEQSGREVEVQEGSAVSDKATLHGEHASIATGTVKYEIYSDRECKELVTNAGEVSVSGATVPASSEETLSPGTYYWQADYSGDSKNPAAKSTCGTEIAIVKPANAQYAALGDSFSSGEGTGTYYGNTNIAANPCHRSATAYPARVAEALFPGRLPAITEEKEVFKQQPTFIFRACSGATTASITTAGEYNEWIEGTPGRWVTRPAQELWLKLPGGETPTGPNNTITLVTFTIGGNDVGFSTIGMNCIVGSPAYVSTARCKEIIGELETGMPALTTTLFVVLNSIHEGAPNARIRVPLYPQILNTAVRPIIRLLGDGVYISNPVDRADSVAVALERFTKKLNHTITEAVQTWAVMEGANATVIPGTVTAFNGHRLGDAASWVNPIRLVNFSAGPESLHPNCLGQLALARRVVQSLGVAPLAKWAC